MEKIIVPVKKVIERYLQTFLVFEILFGLWKYDDISQCRQNLITKTFVKPGKTLIIIERLPNGTVSGVEEINFAGIKLKVILAALPFSKYLYFTYPKWVSVIRQVA
jgi:hypothetical protein